jgi:hypothetical protein
MTLQWRIGASFRRWHYRWPVPSLQSVECMRSVPIGVGLADAGRRCRPEDGCITHTSEPVILRRHPDLPRTGGRVRPDTGRSHARGVVRLPHDPIC